MSNFGKEAGQSNTGLQKLKTDPSPMVRWSAACLDEIYTRPDFGRAVVKGSADTDEYDPVALRMIALYEGSPKGISVVIPPEASFQPLARRLREEVGDLPRPQFDADLIRQSRGEVAQKGRRVLAALEIGQTRTGEEIVSVYYPSAYLQMIRLIFAMFNQGLPEGQLRDAAFTLAVSELQAISFTNDTPIQLR